MFGQSRPEEVMQAIIRSLFDFATITPASPETSVFYAAWLALFAKEQVSNDFMRVLR
jgi:hypothetical protein